MKFLIWTISLFFVLTSCQKELGFGEAARVATFSLVSPSGNCTNTIVNGIYSAGTSLTTDNTVAIKVNVVSVGSYTISTNTVNGISFSASGVFTSTGELTIYLAGNGTPLTAGNFNFIIGTNGCSFSITIAPAGKGTAVFTFNGAPNACTNITRGGVFAVGSPLTSLNRVKIDVNVIVPGTYFILTPLVNGFLFSGSGNLETVGYGTVLLQATGTPIASGTSIFTPSNNGCRFAISVDP